MSNRPVIPFPNGHEVQLRGRLNDAFPDLETDPIDVIASTEPHAFRSVCELLTKCNIRPRALDKFIERRGQEFTTIIPVNEKSPAVRFMIERGTGNRISVVAVSFLTNLGRQIKGVARDFTNEQALSTCSRMTHAYSLGLLAYDVIDPWNLIEDPATDNVTRKLAGNLLCIGIDDGSQGDPPTSVHHYMKATLPARFAAAMSYLDFQASLAQTGKSPEEAQDIIVRFLERRITTVERVNYEQLLAVSDIDHAFAHPLSVEDLQPFVHYASTMLDRGHLRPLQPGEVDS